MLDSLPESLIVKQVSGGFVMLNAKPTKSILFVVCATDLNVEHRHRCLVAQDYRITELPEAVLVTYPANVPFSLITMLASCNVALYVDAKGWVFDEHVVTRLFTNKTLRKATEKDLLP